MSDNPIRLPTPQAMLHRLPDKPDFSSKEKTKPSKYLILIAASTAVAGKVQIAKLVSNALSCPLFPGDSLHEICAKAAGVGVSRRFVESDDGEQATTTSGANEVRYQRMWLSKMTRTGYLFPEESRPANQDFSGFGGESSSTSTSRRGSGSSIVSASSSSSSDAVVSASSITSSFASSNTTNLLSSSGTPIPKYINKPSVLALSEKEKLRTANPTLMVVTHPDLEQWHKDSIRKAVGEYGIGVIFVPLDQDDEELPILKPLDPKTMTSFASLGSFSTAQKAAPCATLDEEIVLRVDVGAKVEDLAEEIVDDVREIMTA